MRSNLECLPRKHDITSGHGNFHPTLWPRGHDCSAETPLAPPPDGHHWGRVVMVGLDLRDREKKIKDGRHVGLDFYDLLIEATKFNQQPPWVGPSPTGDLRR